MEFQESAIMKVDPSKIKYVKEIGSGRFAIVYLATVSERGAGVLQFAAKRLKGKIIAVLLLLLIDIKNTQNSLILIQH